MTIFYLDPEGGSDAADGLTFATRWKTVKDGATAARVAAGDTVRVIASPAPHSLGDATWTDDTRTVVLAAAKTLTIDNCDAAWTAAANVTCTAPTSGAKQGTAYARAAVATGHTTGKIAHLALGATLDLSAYQQVSFWFACSMDTAAGVYELRLCSDATGDVAAHTIPLPDSATTSTGTGWQVIVKDFGAAMSATINSLALYANSDVGSRNLDLDNIIACKARDSVDELTHLSLIGKNAVGEPEWYPIMHIDGTTVHLGADYMAAMNSLPRPYRGTTETVATYARRPLVNIDGTRTASTVQAAGAEDAWVRFSGGWSRTDMSTQDSETWWSASYNTNFVLHSGYNHYIGLDTIGLAHAKAYSLGIGGRFHDVSLLGLVGCYQQIQFGTIRALSLDVGNIVHGYYGLELTKNTTVGMRVQGRRITGVRSGNALYCASHPGTPLTCDIGRIDNNGLYGVSGAGAILRGTTFANNGSGDVIMGATEPTPFTMVGCTLPAQPTVPTGTNSYSRIRLHKYNGVDTDHRIIGATWSIVTDAAIVHSDGLAWKFAVTNIASEPVVSKYAPVELSLAKFAVAAGSLVTCSAWVRRDHTDMHVGIKVLAGDIAGVAADVTAEITAAADVWEQLTLTFTPTEAGVVELLGYAYSPSTTCAGWWDDLSISQA